MRKKILIAITTALVAIIALSIDFHFEKKRAYQEIMLVEKNVFDHKASQIENAFQQIYQGARTISLLPTMKALTGGNLPKGFSEKIKFDSARFPPDAQMTVQQIYNNLTNNISASEVYAVLKGFKPENEETPFFMFDKLVIESESTEQSNDQDSTPKNSDTPEAAEDEEYSYYAQELQSLQNKYPTFDIKKNGIDSVPMTVSSPMRTCDNTQYISKSKGNIKDTHGILFNVPFFKKGSHEFLGIISVIIRSNVFEAMLLGIPYLIITNEDIANAKKDGLVMPTLARFVLSSPDLKISISDRRQAQEFTQSILNENVEGVIRSKLKVPTQISWELLYSVPPEILSKSFRNLLIVFIFKIIGVLSFAAMILAFFRQKEIADQDAKTASSKSFSMVENSPICTMMCDLNGTLTYMNKSSFENFKKLQPYLPEKVENFIGKNIDIFHKNPQIQRKIISDPRNLPHKAICSCGPEKLELLITASLDSDGKYLATTVAWSIVTAKTELIKDLTKSARDLGNAASNVLAISLNLSAAAEETSAQANTASLASEEVNAGVQTVASNMGQMFDAIKEITKTTNEAAAMTNTAMTMANNANQIINQLGESSSDIGDVIKVISSIAQQTNLLALNATIEAARAGEAGKGFAVVANEVKELAKQTSKATGEITKKIETIQTDSKNAVIAIAEISDTIAKINGLTGNIVTAVEAQSVTTNEVVRIVSESAEGVKQISENISQVSTAATNTGKDAENAQSAAKGVGETAELLAGYVKRLSTEI